jgi:hypothetical protein
MPRQPAHVKGRIFSLLDIDGDGFLSCVVKPQRQWNAGGSKSPPRLGGVLPVALWERGVLASQLSLP